MLFNSKKTGSKNNNFSVVLDTLRYECETRTLSLEVLDEWLGWANWAVTLTPRSSEGNTEIRHARKVMSRLRALLV